MHHACRISAVRSRKQSSAKHAAARDKCTPEASASARHRSALTALPNLWAVRYRRRPAMKGSTPLPLLSSPPPPPLLTAVRLPAAPNGEPAAAAAPVLLLLLPPRATAPAAPPAVAAPNADAVTKADADEDATAADPALPCDAPCSCLAAAAAAMARPAWVEAESRPPAAAAPAPAPSAAPLGVTAASARRRSRGAGEACRFRYARSMRSSAAPFSYTTGSKKDSISALLSTPAVDNCERELVVIAEVPFTTNLESRLTASCHQHLHIPTNMALRIKS